jgi:hypothetical protein
MSIVPMPDIPSAYGRTKASMRDKRLFENVVLPKLTPFFSGEYTTSRCEMRFLGKFRKAQPNAIAE